MRGITNACQYLCAADSCIDAVADPGTCDMTKLLPGYSGAKYTCVNGKENKGGGGQLYRENYDFVIIMQKFTERNRFILI